MYRPRRDAAPDPLRSNLVAVRRGLLNLHKALVDAERTAHEREHGALSNARFLQALLSEPAFEWLRPFSRLIVEIDETLATREPLAPEQARSYVEQVRALIDPAPGTAAAERYPRVRQSDPSVLIAHVELAGRIEDADEGTGNR